MLLANDLLVSQYVAQFRSVFVSFLTESGQLDSSSLIQGTRELKTPIPIFTSCPKFLLAPYYNYFRG